MSIRNVFYEITSFHTLLIAEQHTASGKRENRERMFFYDNIEGNLLELSRLLREGKVPRVEYRSFLVYVPKVRKVIYIDYRSKVIQRAIYDILNPRICRTFIKDTYACITGRGQLAAMKTLYRWLKGTRRSGEVWYCYKFDIAKFFYRIDHEIMIDLLRKKIDDLRAVDLIAYYIKNDTIPFGMPIDADQLTITEDEMLYGLGIPIGGGLSHMLANTYLDPLDQYAKRVLRIKKYIRYMDDIIILGTDKEHLKECGRKMAEFIAERLHLQFNNKTALRPVKCGVEFVGYRIWDDHVILRKSTTLRMKRRIREVRELYRVRKIDMKKADQTVQSYFGMLKHCDCDRFRDKLINEVLVFTHEGMVEPMK